VAYEKEDQGDENEFVHFEEEELGGDPEEVIEEETEEELVITERPGAAGAPQPPLSAPKPAAKKKAPAKSAKKAKKAKKKAKAAPKKAAKKKPAKKSAKRKKKALTIFQANRTMVEGPWRIHRALNLCIKGERKNNKRKKLVEKRFK